MAKEFKDLDLVDRDQFARQGEIYIYMCMFLGAVLRTGGLL